MNKLEQFTKEIVNGYFKNKGPETLFAFDKNKCV
jgi:hypothetical protein